MAASTPVELEDKSPSSQDGTPPTPDKETQQESPPYSVFTPTQKKCIACLASFSAVFSTISSFIYYPVITALSRSLNVSIAAINLTVTSYFVVAGLAPSIVGDLADQSGRRPVTLLAFILYLGANLGLALQNSYGALQALRCLQSAAASGTVAIAYGVIADIAPPAERGSYVGLFLGLANAAPSLGPVLGGLLAQKLSWRWIFWFLSICSGTHLLGIVVFLPETSRKVVGNGSIPPPYFIHRSIYSYTPHFRPHLIHPQDNPPPPRQPLHLPNPLSYLVALFQKSTFLVLLAGSLQSALFNSPAASLSTQLTHIYTLNYLTAGLCYLPSGLGAFLGAYFTVKLLDRDYALTALHQPPPSLPTPPNPPRTT